MGSSWLGFLDNSKLSQTAIGALTELDVAADLSVGSVCWAVPFAPRVFVRDRFKNDLSFDESKSANEGEDDC
jgi:hypothetical protein